MGRKKRKTTRRGKKNNNNSSSSKKKKNEQKLTDSPFNELHSDIWAQTFSFLQIMEILEIRRVCQTFQDALENPVSIVTLTNTRKNTLSGFVALFSNFVFYRTKNLINMEIEVAHILWILEFANCDFHNLRRLSILNTAQFDGEQSVYFYDKNLKDKNVFPSLESLEVPMVDQKRSRWVYKNGSNNQIHFKKESYEGLKSYNGVLSMNVYEMLRDGSKDTLEELVINCFVPPINAKELDFKVFQNIKKFHFFPHVLQEHPDFGVNTNDNKFLDYYQLCENVEEVTIMKWNNKITEIYPNLKFLYVHKIKNGEKIKLENEKIEKLRVVNHIIKTGNHYWDQRETQKKIMLSFNLPNCKSLSFSSLNDGFNGGYSYGLGGGSYFNFNNLNKLEKINLDICSSKNDINIKHFQKFQNLKDITLSFFDNNEKKQHFKEFNHNRVEIAKFNNILFDVIKAPSLIKLVMSIRSNHKTKVDCPELEEVIIEKLNRWDNREAKEDFSFRTPNLKIITVKTGAMINFLKETPKLKRLIDCKLGLIQHLGENHPENIENVSHIQIAKQGNMFSKKSISFVDIYKSLLNYPSLKTLIMKRRNFTGKKIKKSDIVEMESMKEIYFQMTESSSFPFQLIPQAFPNLEVFSTNRLFSFSKTDLNQILKKSPFKYLQSMELMLGNEELRKIPISAVYGMVMKYTQTCVNFSLIYDSYIDKLEFDLDMDKRQQLISLKLDNPFRLKGNCENLKYLSCSCSNFDVKCLRNIEELKILEIRKCKDYDVMNEEFIQLVLENVDVYLLVMNNSQKTYRGRYIQYKDFVNYREMSLYQNEQEKRKKVNFDEYKKLQKKFPKQLLIFEK